MLRNLNEIAIHHRNIQTLVIELFKIKCDLAPLIMDSMLNRRTICYNFRNLQEFQSERKRTVFYGLETISYRAPQLWTILPEEFKQRNTISLFKSDVRQWICNECPCRLCKVFVPNLGFIWDTAPNLVFNIYHGLFNVYIYIYIYIYIRLYLQGDTCSIGNILVFGLFDMYLPASTHFINLNFFILLGFFVVDIN